jgi:hypothetical protein
MKKIVVLLVLVTITASLSHAFAVSKEFYQIKIYHLKNSGQEQAVDAYLKTAYLPALHRAGIANVGVFKPLQNSDNERLIYVLIPFKSMKDFQKLPAKLEKDKAYHTDGSAYLSAPYNAVPYDRIESILLDAFEGSPKLNLSAVTTPKSERIYELRSYEGHTEAISKNKIEMFNKGDEIGLFKRLGFNAVFYGEVISGPRMPNLMYLTTFANKADRDQHWDAFGKDAYWKELSAKPEYKNNVSKNVTLFLYPAEYSDI